MGVGPMWARQLCWANGVWRGCVVRGVATANKGQGSRDNGVVSSCAVDACAGTPRRFVACLAGWCLSCSPTSKIQAPHVHRNTHAVHSCHDHIFTLHPTTPSALHPATPYTPHRPTTPHWGRPARAHLRRRSSRPTTRRTCPRRPPRCPARRRRRR